MGFVAALKQPEKLPYVGLPVHRVASTILKR